MSKKLKSICGLLAVVIVLGLFLAGCNQDPVKIQGAKDTKLIEVLVRVDEDQQGSATATLINLKTNATHTAKYSPELNSFCFLVEEKGLYEVTITCADAESEPRYLEVSDKQSYYVLYVPMNA